MEMPPESLPPKVLTILWHGFKVPGTNSALQSEMQAEALVSCPTVLLSVSHRVGINSGESLAALRTSMGMASTMALAVGIGARAATGDKLV